MASPAAQPTLEIWLVSSPTQATRLSGMPLPGWFLRPGMTDIHGTWFVGANGFYLYKDTGFKRAAPLPPGPIGEFQVAGACE